MLNSKLSSLVEFFSSVQNLKNIKTLNYLRKSNYFISVIRSPFVYKKSMDQFFYETYKIYYQTNFSMYNIFVYSYQYKELCKILKKKNTSKLFCKIVFIFN
jgi:hypothetical protein